MSDCCCLWWEEFGNSNIRQICMSIYWFVWSLSCSVVCTFEINCWNISCRLRYRVEYFSLFLESNHFSLQSNHDSCYWQWYVIIIFLILRKKQKEFFCYKFDFWGQNHYFPPSNQYGSFIVFLFDNLIMIFIMKHMLQAYNHIDIQLGTFIIIYL